MPLTLTDRGRQRGHRPPLM